MAKVQTLEQEKTTNAQSSGLLPITLDMPVKSEDDATITGTGASPDGEGLSATASLGLCQREAYCLLVWVNRSINSVLALDQRYLIMSGQKS